MNVVLFGTLIDESITFLIQEKYQFETGSFSIFLMLKICYSYLVTNLKSLVIL